jgi:hypothetical protein
MIDDSGNNTQIVVAAKHGFATMDYQSGALTYIHRTHTEEQAYRWVIFVLPQLLCVN